jgi:N,N'-diacetylchitobiose phosphorylase
MHRSFSIRRGGWKFNKGMKENASIFQHTQGWVVMAEALTGRGDRAYDYYRKFMPSAYNQKAELRETEPYVYCQFTNSKYNPRYGASRLPWLSGTASWAYFTAAQYILGIQPDYLGLRIDPCLPSKWKSVKITRKFRNKVLNVVIKNTSGRQKGVKKLVLNGNILEGNLIPVERMMETNEVLVEL